jgi:hypothetical protein
MYEAYQKQKEEKRQKEEILLINLDEFNSIIDEINSCPTSSNVNEMK